MIEKESGRILAVAFAAGKTHDFTLFKESEVEFTEKTLCLADSGYQGLQKLHEPSRIPKKKSKHYPLTKEEKRSNRHLSQQRMIVEHVIRRVKVFKLLAERYRNRRKRFGIRFSLIAALYNLEYASPPS